MLAGDPFHPSRVDFEKGMSTAPAFALALMAANAAVYAWEVRSGALATKESIIAAGAIYGERIFAGEGWRLVTGMFLHGGLGHLVGNCVALYILGLAAQRAWGTARALLIYFAAGLFASLCSALLQPMPAVGASGAIFGLSGALVVFFYRHSGSFYLRSRRIGAALLGWAVFNLAMGAFTPYVDNWAHLGGLAAGLAAGLLMPSALFERKPDEASVQ
jgi:rhomboid protease GluP